MLTQTSARPSPAPIGHDDQLGERDFARIAEIVGNRTGIKLPPAKRSMVEGRLRRRVRALGLPDVGAYTRHIFEGGHFEQELVHLIDAVTTNKTDFFREPNHFDCLRQRIVPSLITDRGETGRPLLKVWSAASSNGAEAYTIAMVLADLMAQRGDFRFAVLGTDISTDMLAQARRAVFSQEMIAPVPAAMQVRYVLRPRGAAVRGSVRIAPEIRRLVHFQRLNLMDKTFPIDHDVDVIFLRNVLIYFEKADQAAVISRLAGHLRRGGFLILGHSESMLGADVAVRQVAPSVFQKL